MKEQVALEWLDQMFDDANDPYFDPMAPFVVTTTETQRLLGWIAAENDIDIDVEMPQATRRDSLLMTERDPY